MRRNYLTIYQKLLETVNLQNLSETFKEFFFVKEYRVIS